MNVQHLSRTLQYECETAVDYFDIFVAAVHKIDGKISGQNKGNGPFKQKRK